jgi:hypothetical protein
MNSMSAQLAREFFGGAQPTTNSASGAAPVPDASATEAAQIIILTATAVIGAPINPGNKGQLLVLVLIQDATGGRAVTWNAIYKNPPTLTGSAANTTALVEYRWDGTHWQFVGGATTFT